MPPVINLLMLVFISVYGLLLLVDLLVDHERRRRVLVEIVVLAVMALGLHWLTGFPQPGGPVAFGGPGYWEMLGLLALGVLLGMMARYFFYLKGRFSLRRFVRPVLISPIVLLPLVGMLRPGVDWEPQQVVILFILAFQNGFFWRAVFENAKP